MTVTRRLNWMAVNSEMTVFSETELNVWNLAR
jgi:hypothetical protein